MKLSAVNQPGESIRYQRGSLTLNQRAGIVRINHYTYTIPDAKGVSRYVIHMDGEYSECACDCSCPIYCNRPDMACKHMLAIEEWIFDTYYSNDRG